MRRFTVVAFSLVLSAGGCGSRDFQEVADQHVRKDLLGKREKCEAIEFFEKKGHFYDVGTSTTADKDVVLPLLKELKEVAPTDQWVLLKPESTNEALAVLIALPADIKVVDRMAEVVQKADDRFSGFILQQWGHEWLSIDLINKETYEFLKKSNPDIDTQR